MADLDDILLDKNDPTSNARAIFGKQTSAFPL
jgi:hypothetical protein